MAKTCIIVPAYNEEERLPLSDFEAWYPSHPDIHILFVNDGSTDKTLSILEKHVLKWPENASVFDMPKNGGKAEAVRAGTMHILNKSEFNFVGYLDADLATPLFEVDHLLSYYEVHSHLQMTFGSRFMRIGAKVKRSTIRHYLGRVFATAASMLLQIPVYDTQCGAKTFRSDLAKRIFSEPFISSWLFDVELMARILSWKGKKETLQILLEVPLYEWIDKKGSKIKLKHMLKVPIELFQIWSNYRKKMKP